MSENASTENQTEQEGKEKPNHIAGCFIFLFILATVLFLAIFSWWQYRDYKEAIIQISEETQSKTELSSTSDEAKVTALTKKISDFSDKIRNREQASMELDKDELNLAIAHYDKLDNLQSTLFVKEITDTQIITDIAFEVRAGFDGQRFLNGEMKLRPVIAKGSIFPIADEITPDTGSKMPPKMTREFPTLLFTSYRNDKEIEDVFHKLSTVELKGGKMIITSDPDKIDPDAIPEDVSMEESRGLQLFLLLTFIFVSTLAFVFWFKKFKAKQIAKD